MSTCTPDITCHCAALIDLHSYLVTLRSWFPADFVSKVQDHPDLNRAIDLSTKWMAAGAGLRSAISTSERDDMISFFHIRGTHLLHVVCRVICEYAVYRRGDLRFALDLQHASMHNYNSILGNVFDLDSLITENLSDSSEILVRRVA